MKEFLPHALPYVVFVALGAAAPTLGPWTDAARVALAVAALAWFAWRGAYPELRPPPTPGAAALGVTAGIAIGAAWVPLSLAVPTIGDRTRTELDPAQSPVFTTIRIVGMVAVVPFFEELLVRSALPRLVDAKADEDWSARPVGAFTLVSAGASIAFFTLTHPEWLAALVTGLVWTALLARTRNLRAVVISHAVANAWLAGHVLASGESRWW